MGTDHPEPDLTRAHPDGASPRTTQPIVPVALREILFTDHVWRYCEITHQARDRSGGWRILIRYHLAGDTRETLYLHDPAKIRELRDD
jgi:hypothetical protein